MPFEDHRKNILLLGMVYTNQENSEKLVPGQTNRDRIRCVSLERNGYNVYSMDNKHPNDFAVVGRHSLSNFCYPRVMFKEISSIWAGLKFHDICLDYFFSPQGILSSHTFVWGLCS